MAFPIFRAAGAKIDGTGAVTPPLPTGTVIGDICILVATTIAGGTCTITADGGQAWTVMTGSPVDVAAGEKVYVWWRRHASGNTAPTVTPGSDHCCAGIAAYYNANTGATPFEATATGTETASDTTLSFVTGVSTTVNDCLVFLVSSTGTDNNAAQHSAQANASLIAIAEQMDYNSNAGGGGGFEFVQGAKITAGTCGTWTATLATASPKAYINFALKPIPGVTYTKTFTVDAILRATKTKTFTADAILRATKTKTFTADAILRATKTKTFTADAILSSATTYYKTFIADAILKKSGIAKTFTADGLLKKSGLTKTFTADGILAKSAVKTFTADAILKGTYSKTFTADGLLKASGILKTFTADAILTGIDYISYGSPFIYNSANWGSVNYYLEVYMRATSGTVYARLYDITAAGPVTNSAVSTASAAFDRVRSSAVTLTNGNLYRVQFGKISPAAGEFLGGKMVVV